MAYTTSTTTTDRTTSTYERLTAREERRLLSRYRAASRSNWLFSERREQVISALRGVA